MMKLLLTLLLLAPCVRSAETCALPLPVAYDQISYHALRSTDAFGTDYVHLYVRLDYGPVTFLKHLDMFPGKDIGRATKEGNRWMKSCEQQSKKLPKRTYETPLPKTQLSAGQP